MGKTLIKALIVLIVIDVILLFCFAAEFFEWLNRKIRSR